MAKIKGSEQFQSTCVEKLQSVLKKHGFTQAQFQRHKNETAYYTARFNFNDRPHEIEVYEEGPVMHAGEQLFEAYRSEEFESEEALIAGFSRRLDRYLDGGPWENPEEVSLSDWLERLKFWRRWTS